MCTTADAIFTDVVAAAQGVEVVLQAVETAIPEPIIAGIIAADDVLIASVNALKTVYDEFKADTTDKTIIGKVQEAITVVQNNLASLEAAAHIDNATLKSWISKVVGLIATVVKDVATDILPVVSNALETGHVSVPMVNSVNRALATTRKAFTAGYDAALVSSGLPPSVVATEHKRFHDKIARHIGPVRV